MKKKKQQLQQPKKNGASRIWVFMLGIGVLAVLITVSSIDRTPTTIVSTDNSVTPSSMEVQQSESQIGKKSIEAMDPMEIGPQDLEMVLNLLRQNIIASYPVPVLRESFVAAVADTNVRLGVAQRYSDIWGFNIGGNTPLALSAPKQEVYEPGTVLFVFENFIERMVRARAGKSLVEYREYLEDLVLAAYLHEYYHITRQEYWKVAYPVDEVVQKESECWAYTMREVILPMQQGGRGKLLPETFEEVILQLYENLGGNTRDSRWSAFFRQVYTGK